MTLFHLTLETTGFADDPMISGIEMSPDEIEGYNETAIEEHLFPAPFKKLISAQISEDSEEGDTENDLKRFVSITLLVEAEDEEEALGLAPPENLLTRITDTLTGDFAFDIDGIWETAEAEETPPTNENDDK